VRKGVTAGATVVVVEVSRKGVILQRRFFLQG
jgi:hypothetical protein